MSFLTRWNRHYSIVADRLQKKCSKCKQTKTINQFSKSRSDCKQCYVATYLKTRNSKKGYLVAMWHQSKYRNKPNSITLDCLLRKWDEQNGLCHYSTLPLYHNPNVDWKASLERLKLSGCDGYFYDNIALVCQEFNGTVQWTTQMIAELPGKILHTNMTQQYCLDNILLLHHSIEHKRQNNIRNQCALNCGRNIAKQGCGYFCGECFTINYKDIYILQIIKNRLCMAKNRAGVRAQKCLHRGIFELTVQSTLDVLSKQNWRCYYSDI
eukprot:301440_1